MILVRGRRANARDHARLFVFVKTSLALYVPVHTLGLLERLGRLPVFDHAADINRYHGIVLGVVLHSDCEHSFAVCAAVMKASSYCQEMYTCAMQLLDREYRHAVTSAIVHSNCRRVVVGDGKQRTCGSVSMDPCACSRYERQCDNVDHVKVFDIKDLCAAFDLRAACCLAERVWTKHGQVLALVVDAEADDWTQVSPVVLDELYAHFLLLPELEMTV